MCLELASIVALIEEVNKLHLSITSAPNKKNIKEMK